MPAARSSIARTCATRCGPSAPRLPRPEAFLGPGVSGYVEVSADAHDRGMTDFLHAMADDTRKDSQVLPKALPVRLVVLLGGEPGSPDYVLVLSLSRYANLLRLPAL